MGFAWTAAPDLSPWFVSPNCHRYSSLVLEKDVKYCLERSRPDLPQRQGEPVAYYMHGVTEDETHWWKEKYAETLAAFRGAEDLPPFTVVTFETSGTSYFTDRGGKQSGGDAFETWFVTEFLVHVEADHGVCAARECRAILGHSMGGLGAIKTALRFPHLFATVAANSAALVPFNVHAPMEHWKAYFDRHPIYQVQGRWLIWDARRAFPSAEIFDQHDPSVLVAQLTDSASFPKMYLDVGGRDHYGFQEGFFRFLAAVKKRGLVVESNYYPEGTHYPRREPHQRENVLRFLIERIRATSGAFR